MLFYNLKTRKQIAVLRDLAGIHNDRIFGYQVAIDQLVNTNTDLHHEFGSIISKGQDYQLQLQEKISELGGNSWMYSRPPFWGKIYRAWMELKIAISGITKKSTISSCLYNEAIVLHAYRAALTPDARMAGEITQLIEQQEHELKKGYEAIKSYQDLYHIPDLHHSNSRQTLYFS